MKYFLSLFCVCVVLLSCNQHSNNKEKAQALAEKEKELKIKEEALIEREKYQLEQEKLALQEEKKKIAKEKKKVEAQQQTTVTQTPPQVVAPLIPTVAPDAFVRGFLQDLGRRDFKSAFYRCQMSHIKSFRTYEAFSSTNAYGGVSNVEIRKVKILQADANVATVYTQYFAADPYNKDGVYFQNFYLKNVNGNWKIIKIQTTEMAQF